MKRAILKSLTCAIALSISSINGARADRFDEIAGSAMSGGRPTAEAAKLLKNELLFQRATQIYLWALPLINTLGMKYGSEQIFGAGYNVLPIWKDRLDAKTLITTPNSDVLYAMGYADLGETGPLVFEAPPRMQGILLDFWQRPIPGPKLDASKVFAGDCPPMSAVPAAWGSNRTSGSDRRSRFMNTRPYFNGAPGSCFPGEVDQ